MFFHKILDSSPKLQASIRCGSASLESHFAPNLTASYVNHSDRIIELLLSSNYHELTLTAKRCNCVTKDDN